jgi:AcrR family transcriptional regulator
VTGAPATPRSTAAPSGPSPAKRRTLEVAVRLFGEHGVASTSLQMIADALGVTKAAVYHQFRTKEDIVLAAADEPLRRVEAALDDAEAAGAEEQGIDLLVARLVDLAIEHRALMRTFTTDPVLVRLFADDERFRRLRQREHRVLTGGDDGPEACVRAAMVSVALAGAAAHPLVADLDDRTLRHHLLALAGRLTDTGRRR